MADIDQIIAGGASASSRATIPDFSSILDSYYKGKDQAYQQAGRDLFKGGVPMAGDQPDFAAMSKAFFQHGDMGQGVSLSNLDLQRRQLALGQQAASAMGGLEGGGTQPPPQPIISPTTSRNSVTIDPSKRSDSTTAPQPAQQPQQQPTLMTVLAAQNIPNDQLQAAAGSISRQLGVDPSAPLNVQDPQVRNVLVPAIQQLKRMGIGQVVPQGQPSPAPQEIQPVNPQQNQGTFGAPPATPTRGAVPTGTDPEIQKQIATYTYIASNPNYPKQVQEAALTRLKALQDQGQPTGSMKEYDLYRRQGGDSSFADFQAEQEAKKSAATEDAKLNATKYQTIIDNGTKAQQEIPQLQMLQGQMNDPNFFSGSGEKYNLLYKRLKSAVGIDPDAAVPQEMLRKVMASNVLSSLGALKGMGQIRVAEIKMAQTAAASPDNSIPANKLLTEISLRTHQRNADIADMAQAYKDKNGQLDAGFDKEVTQYGRQHPLFTDAEIKDFHNVIGQQKTATSASPAGMPKFNSPSEVHAAIAAGKLKSGDPFLMPNGQTKYAP